MLARWRVVGFVACALLACGGSPAVAPRPVVAPEAHPAADGDVTVDTDAIVAAVSKVRGLEPKSKIEFAILSDEEFSASFGAEVARRRQVRGITSLSVSGASDASFYLAYYDTRLRKVLLRKKTPAWAKLMDVRGLVAHEVEHALQDQYYDLDGMLSAREIDVARARHSLIEGDAQAVAAGAVALMDGLPPRRTIASATYLVEGIGVETYVAGGVVDPRMMTLKPSEREEMLFPYNHGAAFVGALVRTGGFALVDRAFRKPPSSSAEIIHPEAFVAGRGRVELPAVPDLPGWTPSGPKGPYGELALRNVLTSFALPGDRVRALAATWRGDSFAALKDAGGHAAYAWTLVLESEAAATDLGGVLGAHGRVLQKGRVLGYTEGFAPADSAALAQRLVELAPTTLPAPSPPFGAITIAPRPPRLEDRVDHVATLTKGSLRVPGLGIDLRVPAEWQLKPPSDKRSIIAVLTAPAGAVVLSLDSTRQSPVVLRAMMGGVITGFKQSGAPKQRTDETTKTPLGDALDVHVELDTGPHVRVMLLPLCSAESTLMVTSFERQPDATFEGDVERMVNALDAKAVGASPWCQGIHEERTTDL